MKWFGWKAGREGARPALSRTGAAAPVGAWPPSYEAQVRDSYCRNAVAQRAVRLVAEAIGGAPLVASDPALVALATGRSQGQALIETVAAQLLLHGNAFVLVLRDLDGNPAELFALRPERIGGARWRLTRLLRGRRGTEAAAGMQHAGDRFVLLATDTVRALDLPLASLGGVARVLASGVGDGGGPVEGDAEVTGRSVMPPSPVHLTVTVDSSGDATVDWTRRSRVGWRWVDGVDIPLGEETEMYRVVVTPAVAPPREIETTVASIVIAANERAGGQVLVEVRQRGTQAESLPASISL